MNLKKSLILIFIASITMQNVFALNSHDFFKCFIKAADEIIYETRVTNQGDKTRICHNLSQETIDSYFEKLTKIHNGRIYYYSESELNELELIQLYNYMKNDMDCYANKVTPGALINDIINSRTYYRNLSLVEKTLSRMIGEEYDANEYTRLEQLDFSYCKKK